MATLFQVGVGSGGMPVLDLVARDPRITSVTLVDPDDYAPHNVVRHVFPATDVGQRKVLLAERWLRERRPDLSVRALAVDLLDPNHATALTEASTAADLGICAADNEAAKFRFDELMRRGRKPWTLGEVLAGGIGGFVHVFVPGGPCYGCVASVLQRSVHVDTSKPPDYSAPGGPVPEATIPASKAAIAVIAGLHAVTTLDLIDEPAGPGFTSLLLPLRKVDGIFAEAFRPRRLQVARSATCLVCGTPEPMAENLDRALDEALERLGDV
ncbi:MAG TPA: ThiF family adenylyltransferase [Gemmataceae bacterium]|jgi:molybdopterin/thiamine biosynthesis adenylyltransferase|nr:ThiF family adenylyltransferase [Gemmataceae bacterium]